jgi:hypothetical protein
MVRTEEGGAIAGGAVKSLRSSWRNPKAETEFFFYVFIARVLKGPAIRTQVAEFDELCVCGRTKFLN